MITISRFKILDDKRLEFENEIKPKLPSGSYLITSESIVIYDELILDIEQFIEFDLAIDTEEYIIRLDDIII